MRLDEETRLRLCRARELLAELPEGPRHVNEIARAVGISPFHFIRQFERVFGVTPHQFRIAHRLQLAKRLLADGDRSVTDVCMEVGFSSVGSFSALFTRRVGEPPSTYQRRMRVMVPVSGGVRPVLVPGCLTLLSQLPRGAFRSFREA